MGCLSDAPRDNPLDVNNPEQIYALSGTVHTYYPHPPRSRIEGARLLLSPTNLLSLTNQEGTFKFENMPAGNYVVICEKEGFLIDTVSIEIPTNNTLDFFLDGLPYFNQIILSSHRIAHFPPIEDVYYIDLYVTASDTDGVEELQSVWYEVSGLSSSDTLIKTTTPGIFNIRMQTDILGLNHYIGQPFDLFVQDKFGAITESSPHYVTRIIEQIPVLLNPSQGDTISSQPFQLSWQTVFLPYDFHLAIEIMNISEFGFPTLIDFIDAIPSNESSYLYSPNLNPGRYFWTLFIIDEFGNSSRSREGAFIITSG
ncbi:MAG: hypothetical protein JSW33_05530 [bacterium]|nr:MAG: hypothetical protein JSW33_05530 [bacterium]